MRRLLPLCLLTSLAPLAQSAFAQPYYVLVPSVTAGVTEVKVEMARTDLSLSNVQATYVGDGKSGATATKSEIQVYIGPSTSKTSPLLNLTPITPTGGMVILEPVAGLQAIEVSFEIEESPIRTAWKLPLLQAGDFFQADSTAYVLDLVKASDAQSTLQIFNAGDTEATCNLEVKRPKGTVIEERTGITVPALGVTAINDILRAVAAPTASGVNVAVTCSNAFYALGSYPATNRWDSRVEFPVSELPPVNPTADVLYNDRGTFFHCTRNNSDLHLPINLDPSTNYHTMTINFDAAVVDPPGFVVFRNVIGMFRKGGRRFLKTLYFGSFENYDKQKYVIDVGTPFIETTLKRNFPLLGGHTYHFAITLNNDEQSIHYMITNNGGVIMDVLGGLYNNFNVVDGNAPIIEMGLAGIADNAYFPPLGWRFENLSIVANH